MGDPVRMATITGRKYTRVYDKPHAAVFFK
jgi:hypothetical protein